MWHLGMVLLRPASELQSCDRAIKHACIRPVAAGLVVTRFNTQNAIQYLMIRLPSVACEVTGLATFCHPLIHNCVHAPYSTMSMFMRASQLTTR